MTSSEFIYLHYLYVKQKKEYGFIKRKNDLAFGYFDFLSKILIAAITRTIMSITRNRFIDSEWAINY